MTDFVRPTLPQIVARVTADFVSRLALTGAVLRRSMVYVLARVIAGAAHMLHGHLEYLAKQLFPDQSDGAYLVRQASVFGLTKTAATYATGTVTVTGNGTIRAGAVLTRSDGARYTVDAEVVVVATDTVAVTAELAGADSTLTVADVLSFESPVSGIDSTGTVATVVDGNDEETTEALRTRLRAHLAEPAHGGNDADYIAWAKSVAGVTRAWVYPLELGPGTVVVRFARDNDASPIPSAGEVTDVQTAIDLVKPSHATVTVAAPTNVATAFTIAVLPNTTEVKAAVEAELVDLYARVGEPGGTILLSEIRTAIGIATGLTDYTLTVPAADVTHTTGQLPSVGTITWS